MKDQGDKEVEAIKEHEKQLAESTKHDYDTEKGS